MGSSGFLVDFEFDMAVLGIGRSPIGLVAPLRFKTLASLPESSNMGSVSIDFHEHLDFQERDFRKSGFLEIQISPNPDFRISGFPDIPKSGFPDIPKSGYPDIRISGYPEMWLDLPGICG